MSRFSDWLDSLANFGIEPSLDGIEALCAALGRPEGAARVIQITGTNGKTSVARMTGALLVAHGVRAGVYTSPHLDNYRERFLLDGHEIGPREFEALGAAVHAAVARAEGPGPSAGPTRRITQFEALTGAAWKAFADAGVDAAVMEVGMGGRWDATSVARPAASIVTNVTLDHVDWLGPNLTDIAAEKSFVIKQGTVGIIGRMPAETEAVFRARATEVGGRLLRAGRDFSLRLGGDGWEFSTPRARYSRISLGPAGEWQPANALLATVAAEVFLDRELDETAVRESLATVVCPGRAEFFPGRPDALLDGAHNLAGITALTEHLSRRYAGREPVFVVSILKDKSAPEMIEALGRRGRLIFTAVDDPRGLTAAELRDIAGEKGTGGTAAASVDEAVALARETAGESGLIVVTGSLYLIGAARKLFL